MRADRRTPTLPEKSPDAIELHAGADVRRHEQPDPNSEHVSDATALDHQRRHLDLPKTLPVVHRLLLHLRELKKKRDAGVGSA